MEVQNDNIKKLLELLKNSSDWVKDMAATVVESALNADKKQAETVSQDSKTKIVEKQEVSCCAPEKCKCCEQCANCHNEEIDETDDDDSFEDLEFNKMINALVAKHRDIVTKLVKSYNGILDKSKALEILTKQFEKDSIFKQYGITEIDDKSITPRFEAVCAIQSCEEYNILEWRNLLMTHRGYGRLIRMFAEFNSQAQAATLGVKLDIGCQFPPQWNQENKK